MRLAYASATATLVLLAAAALTACSDGDSGSTGSVDASTDAANASAPLEVETSVGSFRGIADGTTRIYRGIRYAEAPVGPLRFAPPRAAAPTGTTRVATEFAPNCPQAGLTGTGWDKSSAEDCLALNIWTPDATSAPPYPVMVFIHGGGFVLGSGSDPTYDGQVLSESQQVVVVTINYRLGPLGFLAHAGLSAEDAAHKASGNWGLLDQQLALRWVQSHIARFGGDPQDVTIFGESAGGYSVCAHLLAPGSRGLFQRAIIESGYCTTIPSPTLAEAEAQGAQVAAALGCTGDAAAQVACMRAKSAEAVTTAIPGKPGLIGAVGVAWGGVVDGVVLTDQPRALLAAGKGAPVPLIVGANSDEGTLFFQLGADLKDEAALRATFAGNFSADEIDEVVGRYPIATYGSANKAAIQIIGDSFVCEARRVARAQAAVEARTFQYHFSRPFKFIFPDLGAFHSAELPFVFGSSYQGFRLQPDDLPLSATMQRAWASFARTGEPGPLGGGVEWARYRADTDPHVRFDVPIAAGSMLRKDACDFFDTL